MMSEVYNVDLKDLTLLIINMMSHDITYWVKKKPRKLYPQIILKELFSEVAKSSTRKVEEALMNVTWVTLICPLCACELLFSLYLHVHIMFFFFPTRPLPHLIFSLMNSCSVFLGFFSHCLYLSKLTYIRLIIMNTHGTRKEGSLRECLP